MLYFYILQQYFFYFADNNVLVSFILSVTNVISEYPNWQVEFLPAVLSLVYQNTGY